MRKQEYDLEAGVYSYVTTRRKWALETTTTNASSDENEMVEFPDFVTKLALEPNSSASQRATVLN